MKPSSPSTSPGTALTDADLDDVAGGFTLGAPTFRGMWNGGVYGGIGGSALGHGSTFIGNYVGPMIGAAGWAIGSAAGGIVGAFDADMNTDKVSLSQATGYGAFGGGVANGLMGTVVEPGIGTALGAIAGAPAGAAAAAAYQKSGEAIDWVKSQFGSDPQNAPEAPLPMTESLSDGPAPFQGAELSVPEEPVLQTAAVETSDVSYA